MTNKFIRIIIAFALLLVPGVVHAQTTYSDNFDSDTTGVIAPGWTAVSGTWTVNTLNPVSSPNDFGEASPVDATLAVYTGMTPRVGMAVQFSEVCEFAVSNPQSNIQLIIATNSTATTGYMIAFAIGTPATFNIYKLSGGFTQAGLSGNVTGDSTGITFSNGTKYTIKADYDGVSTLKFKMWVAGSAEPSSWMGTVVDASPVTTASYCAFRTGLAGTPGNYSEADNFYVGATGASFSAAPTSYTLTGATTLTAGTASTFTVATNTGTSPTSADTLTYSDNLTTHGTFSPTTQAVGTTGATSFSVSYTPPIGYTGSVTLTATSADGLTAGTATATVTNGVATSFTMSESASTGPTGSPVTLTFTGQGTTTATVTPSSTVAGTFSPTSITLNNTTPVTVTYTPSAGGTATITTTNTGSLTASPTSLTYTVTAATTYLATNSLIHYSPYEWYPSPANAAEMETNCSSASATVSVTGATSITVNFDTASPVYAGNSLRTQVDYHTAVNTTVAASVTITLPDMGTHTVQIIVPWMTQTGDRWVTPGSVTRIVSVTVPSGGSLQTVTSIPTPKMLIYSDSRGEGCVINDATLAWTCLLGKAYNCETGLRSFASDGWYLVNGSATATGNIVPFFTVGNDAASIWDKYYSGASLLTAGLFTPAPTYIVVCLGLNDLAGGASAANIEASIEGALPALRAAAGSSCKILVVEDFSNYGAVQADTAIGFAAYQSAHPDSNTVLISGDTVPGLNETGASWVSGDGTHPTAFGHAIVLGQIEKGITTALGSTTTKSLTGSIAVDINIGRGGTSITGSGAPISF